jgi:hypothetical protein
MPETYEEYCRRALGYLGDREPLKVLQRTPAKLERLIRGIPRRTLSRRPSEGKWSAVEILAHIADTEIIVGWRYRNMLATPGVPMQWVDERLWSDKFLYSRTDPEFSAAEFRMLRKGNLNVLRSVPRSAWQSCFGVHDKFGRQTVDKLVTLIAAHDLNHLMQLERLVAQGQSRVRAAAPARAG